MSSVSQSLYNRRRVINVVALLLSCVTALFGLFFLAWILWTLLSKGVPGIDLNLFTKMTPPPMQEGGLLNAFFGSAVMCGLALAIGTPLGIAAGTWLAEYGNTRKTGLVVRFVNDILLSAPSIVLGLFVYTLYVMQTGGRFSAFAGALSLAFIVLPVVVRTTDEMLRLVLSANARSGVVARHPAVEGHRAGAVSRRLGRHSHRHPAGAGAHQRRDRATTVHRLRQSILEQQHLSADGQRAGDHESVRKQPLRTWQTLAWSGALVLTAFVLLVSLGARALLLRNKISND